MLLTSEEVDFWIIHFNGFALDLSIGFFLLYNKTRPYALCVLGLFHVVNSRLFSIGEYHKLLILQFRNDQQNQSLDIFSNINFPDTFFK
jgi:vitamin K-dependent gamma-carboxylase